MESVEEDSIAEVCDEWDTMTVGEVLSVVVEYRTSEYGGYQTEIPCFEALCESVVMW